MSVCLGGLKSLGVTTLGINTGLIATTALISSQTPLSVLTDIYSDPRIARAFGHVLCALSITSISLSTLSGILFACTYFSAPTKWQHPYLLYSMLAGPLSTGYLMIVRKLRSKATKITVDSTPSESNSSSSVGSPGLDSSVIDLGATADASFVHPPIDPSSGAKCPFASGALKSNTSSTSTTSETTNVSSWTKHFVVAGIISTLGLLQCVVGIYGEGMFI